MSTYYGDILGINPEISSEEFSNFVYGLYYLYQNGPTLQTLEQGINLVLGIPLVRSVSTVIDIRFNSKDNRYIIITDLDQYILPEGISPLVLIGDSITQKSSLAKWIELQDNNTSPNWWVGTSIPDTVIKGLSGNQVDRFAKAGSNFDYLMSTYLYKNTFLVRVNTGTFKFNKYFTYLPTILYNVKPSHSIPVYIWKVALGTEVLNVSELSFNQTQVSGGTSGGTPLNAINWQSINQSAI